MAASDEQRFEIATALVGHKYRNEYLNNPAFAREIDSLARMLPAMVDGLAIKAHRSAEELAIMKASMEGKPIDLFKIAQDMGLNPSDFSDIKPPIPQTRPIEPRRIERP